MGRAIKMLLPGIFRLPGYIFRLRKYAKQPERYSEAEKYALVRDIANYYSKFGKVTTKVSGLENLPEEGGFVLTPNHQGMFDIIGLVASVPVPVSMILKMELVKVPVLKRIIQLLDAKPIDRNDVRQSMRMILAAAEEVQQGRRYVIFPEGTRSKDSRRKEGNKVHLFKAGSFKVATKAKSPIVPVAIMNSYRVFETHETGPVTVKFCFLPPIFYEEYKGMTTVELANHVCELIQDTIDKEEAKDSLKFVQ